MWLIWCQLQSTGNLLQTIKNSRQLVTLRKTGLAFSWYFRNICWSILVFVGQSSCMLKAQKSSYLSTMQWEKCVCVCVFSYKVLCPSFPISVQKQSSLLKCDFARRKHGFIIPFICSVLGICSESAGLWECKAHEFYRMIWSWMRGLTLLSKSGWACGVHVGMLAIRLHSCLL